MWCIDWIDLAQDKDRYRVFVNSLTDLRGPKYARNFFTKLHRLSK
jgi:hypothetical protein